MKNESLENTINLDRAIYVMSQNLDNQDSPRVGIFWYDARNDDLFGVVSSHASEARVSKGFATVNTLHRDYWKKQYNKFKFKSNGGEVYPYIGDYKDTPRGRVFYDVNANRYIVNVGSWINEYPQAKALIIDEFNLEGENYLFETAIHWEIGHGWEG
ncbi:MAG: hypothetical protein LBF08_04030 [Dysgonamonadaceae bacterium]|jgi:hypothetical protein|nr:hypothetical protein [Dysgonamonadaceae bacterium]